MPPRAPRSSSLPLRYSSDHSRPLKTAESTARDIVRDIVSGGMRTGDRLPAEPEMIVQYRVSRQSLREALRLLEVQGFIELKRGVTGGPVVGAVDVADFGRMSTLYHHLLGVTYAELVDAWAYGEGQIALLAASHPDRSAMTHELRHHLGTRPAETDVDEYVDRHATFHHVLASHCGNRAIQLALSSYGVIVAHHLLQRLDPRGWGDVVEAQHHDIAEAVVAGRGQRAQELSEAHVRAIAELFMDATGDRLDGFVEWR